MEIAAEIGVAVEGEVDPRYRAGKKNGDGRPRPMIVRIEKDETRERLLANARRLARKEAWKKVFISPDMTYQQREQVKAEEKKLQEEVNKKTDESKNEGRGEKFIVVGRRGERHIIRVEGYRSGTAMLTAE